MSEDLRGLADFPIPVVWWGPRRFGRLRKLPWESHLRVLYGDGRPDERQTMYHRTWQEASRAAGDAAERVVKERVMRQRLRRNLDWLEDELDAIRRGLKDEPGPDPFWGEPL